MPRFKMVDGVSIQLTSAEETARDTEEATWAAGEDTRSLASMRDDRNRLLSASDWYGVSDLTMSSDTAKLCVIFLLVRLPKLM